MMNIQRYSNKLQYAVRRERILISHDQGEEYEPCERGSRLIFTQNDKIAYGLNKQLVNQTPKIREYIFNNPIHEVRSKWPTKEVQRIIYHRKDTMKSKKAQRDLTECLFIRLIEFEIYWTLWGLISKTYERLCVDELK